MEDIDLRMRGTEVKNSITFNLNNDEFSLRFGDDGDIFVNEKLITNDIEIITGLKEFLIKTKCI
jgi:hypothetical protein